MKTLQALLLASAFFRAAQAAEPLDATKETAVIHKYCGGCHSDALNYGGLSVEHFDAARPDPTIAAMLLSKITNGHTPKDVSVADSSAVLKMMRASAMGAAGQGVPDDETQVAFARALALQSKGASEWNTRQLDQSFGASILREVPSVKDAGVAYSYRLSISCHAETREGEVKLTWAEPPAREGQLVSVVVDNATPFQHKLDGGRAQGNGDNGPGATYLKITLPAQSLAVSHLFGEGNVVFPLAELDGATRRGLAACFPAR